jgi:hypothetical protein
MLGTKAFDIIDMDLQSTQHNNKIRNDAFKEREHMEEEGIGNQLSEMQQFCLSVSVGGLLELVRKAMLNG